jgi:phage shock protein A
MSKSEASLKDKIVILEQEGANKRSSTEESTALLRAVSNLEQRIADLERELDESRTKAGRLELGNAELRVDIDNTNAQLAILQVDKDNADEVLPQ